MKPIKLTKTIVESNPARAAQLLSSIVDVERLSQLPTTAKKIASLSDEEVAECVEFFRQEANRSMRKAVLSLYMASLRGKESFENICRIYSERYAVKTLYSLRHVATYIVPFLIERNIEVNDLYNLKNGSRYLLNPHIKGHRRVLNAVKRGISGNALQKIVREIRIEIGDSNPYTKEDFDESDLSPEEMAERELQRSIRERIAALARRDTKKAIELLIKMAKEYGWKGTLLL